MGVRVRHNKVELISIGNEQGPIRETFAPTFLLHIITERCFEPFIGVFKRQMIQYWLKLLWILGYLVEYQELLDAIQ